MSKASAIFYATSLMALAGGISAAHAQDAGSTSSAVDGGRAASSGADEIIVTARRREESLSRVPISIATIGGASLERQAIRSESDLQTAVPGLIVRQTGSSNAINYAIRGQSIDAYSNSAPGVLPYINEVQINTLGAATFYDIDNIQVLKGPQGTLFGRNATGGAVLYQFRQPKDDFEGFVTGRLGSFDSRQLTAAVTLPLAPGIGLRIAGNLQSGGGFVKNMFNGERLGNLTQRSIRGTLKIEPAHGVTNVTTVQYTRDRGRSTPTEIYSYNACGSTNGGATLNSSADCLYNPSNPLFQAYLAGNPGAPAGGIPGALEAQRALGPWKTNIDGQSLYKNRNFFVINSTEIELSPTLKIKNIIGFNRGRRVTGTDFDGTPYAVYHTPNVAIPLLNDTHQFSEELQLQGTLFDSRLNYVVGVYYLNQRDIFDGNNAAFGLLPIFPATEFKYASKNRDRSLAGFVQATYRLTDALNITGGFRYTRDKLSADNLPASVFGASSQSRTETNPSWTASVDYQVTPSLMIYAATRGSWRTGGYNNTSLPLNIPSAQGGNEFAAETTEDVEVGAKFSGYAGGTPVTFSADIFAQWIHDIQRAAFVPVNGNPALVTNNVPQARVTGAEAQFTARPVSWLNAGGSMTYVKARFTEPEALALGTPLTYGPFADVPKWSGVLYAEGSWPLSSDAGTITLRGDLYAQTSSYFSNLASTLTPNTRIPGYAIANARLGWSSIAGTKLSAALYVRNITKEKYYVGGLPTGSGFGINSVSPGRPQSFEGELRFEF
ncbi:TonB-dependent receptor [Sphingobium sp. AN558]|uniref:TonB-dependent receptor n=1 Tax=Sphingobium sp. AN558 TaxID=3133442 RepID=UPI0030C464BC